MYSISKATNDFIKHCKIEKALSPKTVKAYRTDLTQLIEFLKKRGYTNDINAVSKNELRDYIESKSTLKPKSLKRKIASIKAMFSYLEFEERIVVNPLRKMRIRIKEPFSLPRVLNIGEVRKIFDIVYEAKIINGSVKIYPQESLRNIVIIELLFVTGARVSELANLKSSQIDLVAGIILFKGKGNKERLIQICNLETLKILRDYQSVFQSMIQKSGYFLVNRFKNKLSDQTIRNVVKKVTLKAGISQKITPHSFRHTFATLLLENDVDIKYIQLLLGHSSIATTQIYTHVNREKQKQILTTKHPRKDFFMHV